MHVAPTSEYQSRIEIRIKKVLWTAAPPSLTNAEQMSARATRQMAEPSVRLVLTPERRYVRAANTEYRVRQEGGESDGMGRSRSSIRQASSLACRFTAETGGAGGAGRAGPLSEGRVRQSRGPIQARAVGQSRRAAAGNTQQGDRECRALARGRTRGPDPQGIEKALEGDPRALRLCLDRLIPPRRRAQGAPRQYHAGTRHR